MVDRTLVLLRSWLLWEPPPIIDLRDHSDFASFLAGGTEKIKESSEPEKIDGESGTQIPRENPERESGTQSPREKPDVGTGEQSKKFVYSLAGGCASELDLYFVFRDMEIKTKSVSMWLSMAFHVLANGMFSLPSRLTRKFTHVNRSFLKELMKFAETHKKGMYNEGFVITSRSHQKLNIEHANLIVEGTGDATAHGIVHPMGLKYEFLLHLVDTLIQLLRIDGLYSSEHI
eukprot:Phypoly_transcript_11810.p1 GENE.Phypoly_transcript_11810~~Phypoly_transcript_11810.p1  ORF type:complete len:231 (+),score=21.37 Phypoly_transcript_11810:395-1087(+)